MVCAAHARVSARWLTRAMALTVVAVEPPARIIRCGICHAAAEAVPQPSYAAG